MLNAKLVLLPPSGQKKIYLKNYILLQVSEGTVAISLSVFPAATHRPTFSLSNVCTHLKKKAVNKQTNPSPAAHHHPVMWMSEAEVRAAPFPLGLRRAVLLSQLLEDFH